MHHRGDVFIHAAINQNLFKRTAAADDQQHHGDDFDRRAQGIVNLIHATSTVQAEGEEGNQHRNQGSHNRVAEEFSHAQESMTFWQNHLRHGAHRHQHNRYQRGPDADAKAWHLFFREGFSVVQTFRNRLVDPFQAACKHRACEDNGRDSQNSTEQQGFTHIGMEDGRDCGRARVRWQEAVRDGERRRHRNANEQQRDIRRGGNGEHQRQHQYETDFIEEGETHGKAS